MAESEKVQLLGLWASPYVMRVQVALALKGVEYENVPEDLRNKSELLLQSNPVYKKVPVLLHNGRPICESLVIIQYVEEAWPSPALLPADPYGRAMARFWMDFVDKKVLDALFAVLRASAKESPDEKEAAEENAVALLATLEEALPGKGPFFGGGQMGLLDVVLAPLLAWMPAIEQLAQLNIPWAEKLPRLQAQMAAMRSHPSTAGLPQPPKISDFVSRILLPRFQQP